MPDMRFSTLLLAGCAAFLLSSCGSDSFKITGSVKGMEGKTIYLQKFEKGQPVNFDSTVIGTDGAFTIETKLPYTDYYQLLIDQKNAMVFVGDSVGELTFETGATLGEPKNIEGQEDTKMLYQFDNSMRKLMMGRDSVIRLAQNGKIPEQEAMSKIQAMNLEVMDFLHKFIDQNYTSPAALAALNRMNPMQDMAYFQKVINGIEPRMGRSDYYQFLKQQVELVGKQPQGQQQQPEETDNITIGSVPPAISLPDPSGKVHSLAEFKGKVLLIDFWASWCGPCRQENPNVVGAYKEFHGKGFEILSVSLDKSDVAWKNAIAQDKLSWTHVSDLKYWDSKAAADYGVKGIPFAVLVGRDGKVIAKNLRGEELSKKLKEILG